MSSNGAYPMNQNPGESGTWFYRGPILKTTQSLYIIRYMYKKKQSYNIQMKQKNTKTFLNTELMFLNTGLFGYLGDCLYICNVSQLRNTDNN